MEGCFTALITPFNENNIDESGLNLLIDFQIENGISGIVAVGTTGESPTLTWEEHKSVIDCVAKRTKGKCICIAGTGSNNTKEAIEATSHAVKMGVDEILLIDPYYNGPSSLEIRREYIEPVCATFPDTQIIPYIIPGRTGTQLLPEDLAILHQKFKNLTTVKEATGDLGNMRRTRECCGNDFNILSGDDGLTFEMITDPKIKACGAISVISNIFPDAVTKMIKHLNKGEHSEAKKLEKLLNPIFGLVTIKTKELTPFGEVICKARNPLAIKTLMSILGMPSGKCRKPLGKVTMNGFNVIIEITKNLYGIAPDLFMPISKFFGIDIEDRLNNPIHWEGLYYESY